MRIVNKKNETQLIINPDTFAVEKSNDPIFEATWNGWLDNGLVTIVPMDIPKGIPEDTDIIFDGRAVYTPSPKTRGLVDVELLPLGLRIID